MVVILMVPSSCRQAFLVIIFHFFIGCKPMAAKQVEVQWLEGWLRLHVGPSAESVQVTEQALTSALCQTYDKVRNLDLTCSEVARALQHPNEPSRIQKSITSAG